MFIMMEGNLTEGYKAYGPYESFDDAADAHACCEGWIMEMNPANKPNHDKTILVGQHVEA